MIIMGITWTQTLDVLTGWWKATLQMWLPASFSSCLNVENSSLGVDATLLNVLTMD